MVRIFTALMPNGRMPIYRIVVIGFTGFLLFWMSPRAFSQAVKGKIVVTGQLVNSFTLKPVPFAHVVNISHYTGAISDTAGKFTIRMDMLDTLMISAIGYERKIYLLPSYVSGSPYSPKIYLKEMAYSLGEVQISPLGTYSQFKGKVSDLQLPETDEEKLRRETMVEAKEVARENFQIPTGITFRIPTKNDIQWQKVQQLEEIEKRQMILYRKYNREVIARTTHLEGDLLDEFIIFCNQRAWFTPETNSYDIIYQIKIWYKQFMAMKGRPQSVKPKK
jgi:hypothetical protein